jgi:hypothetical protein
MALIANWLFLLHNSLNYRQIYRPRPIAHGRYQGAGKSSIHSNLFIFLQLVA